MLSVPGAKSLAENTSHSAAVLTHTAQEELDSGPLVQVLLRRSASMKKRQVSW